MTHLKKWIIYLILIQCIQCIQYIGIEIGTGIQYIVVVRFIIFRVREICIWFIWKENESFFLTSVPMWIEWRITELWNTHTHRKHKPDQMFHECGQRPCFYFHIGWKLWVLATTTTTTTDQRLLAIHDETYYSGDKQWSLLWSTFSFDSSNFCCSWRNFSFHHHDMYVVSIDQNGYNITYWHEFYSGFRLLSISFIQ